MPGAANDLSIYLYIYRCRATGKAYIGITSDPQQRFKKHETGKSNAVAFNRATKKYGIESFDFKILAIFDDIEAANYHENAAIAAFGTLSPNGYNLIGGAPRSKYFGPHSQESKDKIGKANRNNYVSMDHIKNMVEARKGKPNHFKGKSFSAEHRAKLSDAHKGVPLSKSHQENKTKAIKMTWKNKTSEQMDEYSQKPKKRWANYSNEQRRIHAENTSNGLMGRTLSIEHRKKISETLKNNMTPERREICSQARKGKPISEEHKRMLMEGNKRYWEKRRVENAR